MWAVPGYRANSPGERLVPVFLKHVLAEPGEWIVDLGCGTGRASMMLQKAGFKLIAVDIVENCLDPQLADRFHFIRDCLWNFRLEKPVDWFYCCDVMEHIPPEKVDAVLDTCAQVATKGGFFQIALFNDAWGNSIGETLHLTVKDKDWWLDKLNARWKTEDLGEVERMRLCAIVRSDG